MGNVNAASDKRPGHSGRPRKRTAELIKRVGGQFAESKTLWEQVKSVSQNIPRDLQESASIGFKGLPIHNTDKADSDKEQKKTMAVKILKKV